MISVQKLTSVAHAQKSADLRKIWRDILKFMGVKRSFITVKIVQNLTVRENIWRNISDINTRIVRKANGNVAFVTNILLSQVVYTIIWRFTMKIYINAQYVIKSLRQKTHNYLHTRKMPFKCDLCEKSYRAKLELKVHRDYKHFNIKPFPCQHCDRGYVVRTDLKRHIEVSHPPSMPVWISKRS